MSVPDCPNMLSCKLVHDTTFIEDTTRRERYISMYCTNNESGYSICKRFITKENIHFCPDFVLPDSSYTIDEIIERFEEFDNN